jgi:pantoate--beta-alanine ligase
LFSIDSKITDKNKFSHPYLLKSFNTIKETKEWLHSLRKEAKTIGFVPTMGALHRGHISLLERSKRENDITVSSIFVNPLQFNDKKDLEKYPRTLESDSEKLMQAHCDVLFAPSTEEMYPSSSHSQIKERVFDLGMLDKVMEGTQRPGHFQGVCVIVKKLFEIVQPDKAYFGEKDFQQLAIIRHMVKTLNLPVKIIPCPTVREADGLAMSSRNVRLNTDERKNAPVIYKTMVEAKVLKMTNKSVEEIKKWVAEKINGNPFMELDYFEIVNAETLMPVQNFDGSSNMQACIAVKTGGVRLIDNIPF